MYFAASVNFDPFPTKSNGIRAYSNVHSSVGARDEDTLRLVFDSQPFWKEFSNRTLLSAATTGKQSGLLQNQYLTSPEGFHDFAIASLRKCQRIVDKVLAANTFEDYKNAVKDCDQLSDMLCRVMDIAEFIRMNHPNSEFQSAAGDAHAMMFQYMNVLNTTPGLNEQLSRAASDPEITKHWSAEEKITADILIADFAKSGIHLPPQQRKQFVELSSEINDLGVNFVQRPEPEKYKLTFSLRQMQGMDPMLLRRIRGLTNVSVPIADPYPHAALSTVHNEGVRKEIYQACRTASKQQIRRLERLLEKRAELAKLTGFASYGHMALSDKMSGTPEAVTDFLVALNSRNSNRVKGDLNKLFELKKAHHQQATSLQPWDFSYYLYKYSLAHGVSSKSRVSNLLTSYFSLGTVIQGLSSLFHRLYGVRFIPSETEPGETWDPEVRRLNVVDETNNQVAVLYCDLFTRPGKSSTPTHFTLRCSRAISEIEIAEIAQTQGDFPAHPNDGMATGYKEGSKTLYQLPVVALICNFSHAAAGHGACPTLLSEHDVNTIFHEMGHAVHSILGRTNFQTISGTRCATDFAELPSVFNENFAFNPSVLSLYARHWETGNPISEELLRSIQKQTTERENLHGPVENENQILMALLDQAYHDSDAARSKFNTTEIYRRVYDRYSSLPDPPEVRTAWQGFFGHLFGYGATYYSYLLDRAIAGKIWSEVFKNGEAALDRNAGELMKNEILRWGGGRNGWECIAGVLGDVPGNENGKLAAGGAAAMREVGSWGVGYPSDD
ncbi:Mitochondrial intermediate peptidase [Ascosphaera aggregata]|nr:Mitochondrial intermediate peptidase [Ascosphaera aggregata]